MRYLLFIVLILAPLPALALTGDAARFDFSQGQPAIVDDATSTCNSQATVRYDFVSGQPAPVFDSTATCTAAVAATTNYPDIIFFE